MKIIRNEKLIERNGKIANYVSIGGIAVFGFYAYYTVNLLIKLFRSPETVPNDNPLISIGLLILAFILVQITSYLGPKFGKSPRIDEKIDASLKGLHSDFHIFHYSTPVSHLLVGPSGIWVILAYGQSGEVDYSNDRWKLSGGTFSQKYMRLIGMERLGRPDADANSQVDLMRKFLSKKDNDLNTENIKAIIVFTNEDIQVTQKDSPIPAMKLKQLKEFLRQESKRKPFDSRQLAEIIDLLN